jgi:hypothetical protein
MEVKFVSIFTRNRIISEKHLNFFSERLLFQDYQQEQSVGDVLEQMTVSVLVIGACTVSVTIVTRVSLLSSEYLRSVFPPKSTTQNFFVVDTHSVAN